MVTMGEVHTGLLRNSVAVSVDTAGQLLRFAVGERVRTFERPIAHAVSPELLTGVDCHLPTGTGQRVRAVGTAVSRANITGGHVVQGSAFVRVAPGTTERRQPWSHYLAHPGVLETIGKATPTHVADGFLSPGQRQSTTLDLGAIGAQALGRVQDSTQLNQTPPFRSQRTRLRWVVGPADDGRPTMTFRLDDARTRSARLPHRDLAPAAIASLCEDLALHDWLLTTLLTLIGRAPIGSGDRARVVSQIQPALDYLLHLWMPAARVDDTLVDLWEALERRPGLSRQWQAAVHRIRDQLALAAVTSPIGSQR